MTVTKAAKTLRASLRICIIDIKTTLEGTW